MGIALAAITRIPVIGSRLNGRAWLATPDLGALCNAIATGGVLAALLLLPLVFFTQAQAVFSVPKAALLHAIAAVVLVATLVKLLAGRPFALYRSPLDLPIAAYLGLTLLGTLRATARDAAIFGVGGRSDGLLTLLSVVALFYVAYHLPAGDRLLRRGLACAAVAAGLVAGEGIAEALGYSLVGFDPALWGGRAFSTAGNPDFLGGILVLALPLPLALLATAAPRLRPLWAAVLAVVLVGLFVTLTRGAWVGSLGVVVTLLVLGRDVLRQSWRWLLPTLVVFVAFVLLFESGTLARWRPGPHMTPAMAAPGEPAVTAAAAETLRRPSALERLRMVADGSGRLLFWEGALGVVREQPIFGAGYGNLFTAITRYLPIAWARQNPDTWVDKAHNAYLDHAASLGVPGLAAYLWLLGSFAFAMWDFLRGKGEQSAGQRTLLVAIFAGWLGYLVHLFFLFDTVDSLALFWLLMGLACHELRLQRRPPTRTLQVRLPAPARAGLALAVIGLGAFGVNGAALPVAAEAQLWRAQSAGTEHRTAEAVSTYLQAVALFPPSESAQWQAAIALAVMGSVESDPRGARHLLDEAVRLWGQAIRHDPEYAYLYAMRGETYTRYREGEHMGDALDDFRRATMLYPHYYNAYAGVADAAHALGRLSEAIAAERKLLELDPNNQQVLRVLAQDYVRSGRFAEAVATWERLAALGSDSADLRLSTTQAWLMAGQKERALAALERARSQYPDDERIQQLWQSVQKEER